MIELKPGANRFGRGLANDYPLNHPAVSDQHCEIMVEEDFVLVRDLGSTNGTFIDAQRIQEAALRVGQILKIGPLEMVLDDAAPQLAIPSLPQLSDPLLLEPKFLADGFAACVTHGLRHAVWQCSHCTRYYCDPCIKKIRRVGGVQLKLCPTCSHPCKYTPWSEMMRGKKKSFFGVLADKVSDSFKQTKKLLSQTASLPRAIVKRRPKKK